MNTVKSVNAILQLKVIKLTQVEKVDYDEPET